MEMRKQRNKQFMLYDSHNVQELMVLGNAGAGVKGHQAEIRRTG